MRAIEVIEPLIVRQITLRPEDRTGAIHPAMCASPGPVLGPGDQLRGKCIPFNVSQYPAGVDAVLHRYRQEASLVDMAGPFSFVHPRPLADVRARQPVHRATQLRRFSWDHDQMPVIGHQAIPEQANFKSFSGPGQQFQKELIISRIEEQGAADIATVDDVMALAILEAARHSGHARVTAIRMPVGFLGFVA